jgi:pyridoxal phosphate enzyme (YggS family)
LLAITAQEAGRRPEDVKLLAVSKKQPVSKLHEAIAAGQWDFGENQVVEGVDKIRLLNDQRLTWHFIGHLQTNKTRLVAEHFDWVHSIDRFKTARRLSEQRPDASKDLNLCIQVNVDEETTKSGVPPSEVLGLARQIAELPRLHLRGLMCLPRIRQHFEDQRRPFARLREIGAQLRQAGIDTDTLSMGMSDDYRAAIFEGATIVRIGTAVFGPRNQE